MTRKVLGALAGAAVVAVAVWFLFFRGGGETKAAVGKPASRSAVLPGAPPAESQSAAARALAADWSLDTDPEGPLRLEGQVQGENGEPIGGATVTLSTSPSRTAKSEDDGSFFFDKLVGRTYYLSATSGQLVGGPVTYKLGNKQEPVVIRMAAGAKLEVTVVGIDKQPIADADVKNEHDVTAKTDAAGKATLTPVRTGWSGVQVSAKGYAPASSFTTVGSAGSTGKVTVTLKKGIEVTGRVIDDTGKPVAAAHVTATSEGAMWGMGSHGDPVMTNEKGEFTMVLPAGGHRLKATDGEHAPSTSASVTVRDAPVTGIEIAMKGGAAIVGRVDDKDGKPVAFATVRVGGAKANMWDRGSRSATTDKAGRFELHGLARSKHQARAESDISASKIVDIDLTNETTKRDVVLVLDVSGTIMGTVVDETGQPVPEVTVNAFPDILGGAKADGLALAGMSSATTDGNGAFAVHGLPDGAYRMWASRSAGGFRGGLDDRSTPASTGDKGVKLTLAAPGTVIGKLALDGKPPTMATIQIGPQGMPVTVEAGAFTVKDVTPGTLDAIFHGPEFAELIKHDVKVEPGKTTDLGTIDVSRGRVVTGKVVDASGTAVAGARVRLGAMLFSFAGADDLADNIGDMRGMRTSSTDQDGNFSIAGVSKKAQYIAADQADKGQSTATQLPDGTDDPPPLTLALRGWGSITGTVTMKGVPQPGVNITETTQNGGAQMAMTQTDVDGNFAMLKVAEGTHVLAAMQAKGMMMSMKSTSATAVVTAGKESHVVIDIPVGQITLTVALHPLPNNTVTAAQVFLLNGLANVANAKQLQDGFLNGTVAGMKLSAGLINIEFDELMPGDYTVCTVPITGNLFDPQFQQRLQEHMQDMHVYCKTAHVNPSPNAQTFNQDVPAMTPLPQ